MFWSLETDMEVSVLVRPQATTDCDSVLVVYTCLKDHTFGRVKSSFRWMWARIRREKVFSCGQHILDKGC